MLQRLGIESLVSCYLQWPLGCWRIARICWRSISFASVRLVWYNAVLVWWFVSCLSTPTEPVLIAMVAVWGVFACVYHVRWFVMFAPWRQFVSFSNWGRRFSPVLIFVKNILSSKDWTFLQTLRMKRTFDYRVYITCCLAKTMYHHNRWWSVSEWHQTSYHIGNYAGYKRLNLKHLLIR